MAFGHYTHMMKSTEGFKMEGPVAGRQKHGQCPYSFGNSLLYSTVLSESIIPSNPTISYLHEPFDRRYSLALDLSELFKPILVDRLIFYLVNKRMLKEEDFEQDINYCLLNDKGRKIFLKEYDERLKKTIKHRELNRKVSYRRLIG